MRSANPEGIPSQSPGLPRNAGLPWVYDSKDFNPNAGPNTGCVLNRAENPMPQTLSVVYIDLVSSVSHSNVEDVARYVSTQ